MFFKGCFSVKVSFFVRKNFYGPYPPPVQIQQKAGNKLAASSG
jgi:hypothetical protein